MRYETKASYAVYDAEEEREHGPRNDVEVYWNEDTDLDEITLMTNEREDFERETGTELIADVVPMHVFEKMVEWCKENNLLHEEKK